MGARLGPNSEVYHISSVNVSLPQGLLFGMAEPRGMAGAWRPMMQVRVCRLQPCKVPQEAEGSEL